MLEVGSIFLVVLSAASLCGLLRLKGWTFNLISFWLSALFLVVMTGYIASFFDQFGHLRFWVPVQLVMAVPLLTAAKKYGRFFLTPLPGRRFWRSWQNLDLYRKTLLAAPLLTCVFLGIANGTIVWFCSPHHWDSLTYHLPRVAYYLQNGNLHPYPANYWAQTMHPKVSSVIQAWIFLVSGRNENLFQLLQFSSYWIAMLALYGLCRGLFNRRGVSLFVALIFGLLVEVLLQASMPNNDLFITALVACVLCSLMAFRQGAVWRTLIPCSLAAGLAAGTKASFALAVPSIAVIAAWVFVSTGLTSWKDGTFRSRWPTWLIRAVLPGALAVVVVFPSGYIDNLKLYGHPLGSEQVREHHTFKGKPLRYVAKSAGRNFLRYGMDSLALECPFPSPWIAKAHDSLRRIPRKKIERAGIDLKQSHDSIYGFSYGKDCTAHEDISYWGIAGFALVFPCWIFGLFRRNQWSRFLPFCLATVLFVFCQAWGGPYDPWRGRYFIQLALFSLPMLSFAWNARWRTIRGYVSVVVALACLTAVCAVVLRPNRPLISCLNGEHETASVFNMTREQQMTANLGGLSNILSYEKKVPLQAVVGVRFPENKNEYALFGKGLTRTVIPFPADIIGTNPFTGRVDYVVYSGSDSGGAWIVRDVRTDETAEQAFEEIKKDLHGAAGSE